VEEQNKALDLLYRNSAIDIMDIHYYTGAGGVNLEELSRAKRQMVPMDIQRYTDSSARIGKPLMIGEAGASPAPAIIGVWELDKAQSDPRYKKLFQDAPDYFDSYQDPRAIKWVKSYCDEVVTAVCSFPTGGVFIQSGRRYQESIGDMKKGKTDPPCGDHRSQQAS